MYESFFSMTATPFVRNIPIDKLYRDRMTDEIHDRLLYAAQHQWFGLLVGDAGCGKTTTIRRLASSLDENRYSVLYLADSKMTPRTFYNGLLEQLGCEGRFYRGDARKLLHKQIEIMRGVQERRLVVIVDESHLLSREMLEEIRFLLNYRMDSENPLALILSGQSELWDKLQTQAYRAIRHRVDVECFLTTYDYAQTKAYVEKQLIYAGRTSPLFTDEALRCIYDYSSGLPRLINRACTQALGFAFQNGNSIVDDHIVKIVLTTELNTVA